MIISIVIKESQDKNGRTFLTASAKGKYLNVEVNRFTHGEPQDSTNFWVKIPARGENPFPGTGVFSVQADNMWLDSRPDIKHPTVWLKGNIQYKKKYDLKPLTPMPKDSGAKVEPLKVDIPEATK